MARYWPIAACSIHFEGKLHYRTDARPSPSTSQFRSIESLPLGSSSSICFCQYFMLKRQNYRSKVCKKAKELTIVIIFRNLLRIGHQFQSIISAPQSLHSFVGTDCRESQCQSESPLARRCERSSSWMMTTSTSTTVLPIPQLESTALIEASLFSNRPQRPSAPSPKLS
jgi:hypothetical protein